MSTPAKGRRDVDKGVGNCDVVAGAGIAPAFPWLCLLLQFSLLSPNVRFVVWTVPFTIKLMVIRQPVSTPSWKYIPSLARDYLILIQENRGFPEFDG